MVKRKSRLFEKVNIIVEQFHVSKGLEKLITRELKRTTGVTVEQNFVLDVIDERGITNISEIAHLKMAELSTISMLISRMEKNGLVEKTRSGNSKTYTIKMTKKARETWDPSPVQAVFKNVLSVLSEEEMAQYDKILDKLLKKILDLLHEEYSTQYLRLRKTYD